MTPRRTVFIALLAVAQLIIWLLQIGWHLAMRSPNYGLVLLACFGSVVALIQLGSAAWQFRH